MLPNFKESDENSRKNLSEKPTNLNTKDLPKTLQEKKLQTNVPGDFLVV